MAKKKAQPPDESPKRRGRAKSDPSQPQPDPPAPTPAELRELESLFSNLLGGASVGESPPSPAESLLAEAFQAATPAKQNALAKKAIAKDPDCAEAYTLLAENARDRKQALAYLEQALAAAERALGPEVFKTKEGRFWEIRETRTYMQARQALAEALWTSGRRDEAAEHLLAMIRLNPNDNQGVRYALASWLINLDRLDDLDALLERFREEDSATLGFTRALLAFRRQGDTPAARKLLRAAKKGNKFVPDYLLGEKTLPAEPPQVYSPGGEDEAILYVGNHLGAWKATPGAISWARATLKPARKKAAKPPAAEGPTPRDRAKLLELPEEYDIWQVDFRQFARRIEVAGERIRPWMMLVASRTNSLVLAHDLAEQLPTPAELWDLVASAIRKPFAGEPHRPAGLEVRTHPQWDALENQFEAIGVEVVTVPELDQIDLLFDDLTRHLAGAEPPGILDMPGVKPEQVARLFQAAASFYRRAPWRSLGYEAVIRVECDRYESGPWFAVVMGQSGLTLGVALYEDLKLLQKMWSGKLSDEEGARKTVALTVTFDDESSLPEADLEAIEAHDFEIAAPEAYPSVFRKERGLSMRPPLSWEIDLLDACLRALPDFIARRRSDDPTRELVPVLGTPGPIELGLSWVPESN
ncbi:DUF7309 domain-containing protein [Tundrisphaera sp. TA3]|uniref:DUF7309 domain-containing protein n=1 Tax=Tundrisphaera sp. TA3 TaxID=3435775 RepID=UPI003EBECDBC